MRIIAITNQKGGVGKTTTVMNVAAALAQRGKRVILIDLDPQAHLTTCLGVNPAEVVYSCHDVLIDAIPLTQALIPCRDGIKLLASGLDLAAAEQELVSIMGRETILRDAIADFSPDHDYILMDCPPSLGLLTLNALGAAREVFITLQPHFLSLQGLSQLLETVLLVHRRINSNLQVTGLTFCMYDSRTSLSGEIARDVADFFAKQRQIECPWQNIRLFNSRIRRNVKLAESPSYGQAIFEYAPKSNGAEDYLALTDEIEAMISNPENHTAQDTPESASSSGPPDINVAPTTSGPAVGNTGPTDESPLDNRRLQQA